MSFDVFVQRFENGEPRPLDYDLILTSFGRQSASPLRTPSDGFLELETDDGGADVYGLGPGTEGLMFNNIAGLVAWEVIWKVANDINAVILPVGAPTMVTSASAIEHLPTPLQQETMVITEAIDLHQAILTS